MVSKKKASVVVDVVKKPPLKTKEYEKELRRLHVELVKLQQWVVSKGLKVCIVFEGRDGAGKGGTIKAITERVSPRVFRVVALPAPTDKEKTQLYFQRYVPHLPSAGEIVIFDRSWYNRAGVERVMGFCTPEQVGKVSGWCPGNGEINGRRRDNLAEILAGGDA
ncbi:polyphosphate kinase 2 [Yokenella regensburgei]|nr:polyphosphate kinase 2 [Yokenella regensburgei]